MTLNNDTIRTKPHLQMLDALRGVAALIVLWYHCNEGFGYEIAPSSGIYTQPCDHGYLAVDFFFILSGFVIGYAYDDRWKSNTGGMGIMTFFKRRLIRLHPMVVAGGVVGLIFFLIGGATDWWGNQATAGNIVLIFLMTLLMIPTAPGCSTDVRGNGEMYPLNGPYWSLFFEYIGNILYALLLRRLPNWALAIAVALSGGALAYTVIENGYLGVGWSFVDNGFALGMLRLLFPYSLGMLMARLFVRRRKQNKTPFKPTFLISALLLVVMLSYPFVGDPIQPWQNGLYIMVNLAVVFPTIVWFAAKAGIGTSRMCNYLGEVSYPLYAIHYPVMYIFYQYLGFPDVSCTMADVWPWAMAAFVGSIVLATVALYAYDKPVRRWLSKR